MTRTDMRSITEAVLDRAFEELSRRDGVDLCTGDMCHLLDAIWRLTDMLEWRLGDPEERSNLATASPPPPAPVPKATEETKAEPIAEPETASTIQLEDVRKVLMEARRKGINSAKILAKYGGNLPDVDPKFFGAILEDIANAETGGK